LAARPEKPARFATVTARPVNHSAQAATVRASSLAIAGHHQR
jgi:hypothetical protein